MFVLVRRKTYDVAKEEHLEEKGRTKDGWMDG